jgi:hypothetical protein
MYTAIWGGDRKVECDKHPPSLDKTQSLLVVIFNLNVTEQDLVTSRVVGGSAHLRVPRFGKELRTFVTARLVTSSYES